LIQFKALSYEGHNKKKFKSEALKPHS